MTKKITLYITIIFLALFLFSCQAKEQEDIIIHKYFENGELNNTIIELHNPLNTEVNLEEYNLKIYKNSSQTSSKTINLTGSIPSQGFYLIANSNIEHSDIKEKANLLSKDLLYNGNDAISITKHNKIVDIVGALNAPADFGKNVTLVRYNDKLNPSKTFKIENYIHYKEKYYDIIGKKADLEREEILKGPVFDEKSLAQPFLSEDPEKGGGGSLLVEVKSEGDGDTTVFDFNITDLKQRVRYRYIDTPESTPQGGYNPWGKSASITTNTILRKANKIYIQSIPGLPIKEGFGRTFAIVWADSKMIAFTIALEGFSQANVKTEYVANDPIYKNIPYSYYIKMAALDAKSKGKRIHGEKDPYWDYKKSEPKTPCNFIPDFLN